MEQINRKLKPQTKEEAYHGPVSAVVEDRNESEVPFLSKNSPVTTVKRNTEAVKFDRMF